MKVIQLAIKCHELAYVLKRVIGRTLHNLGVEIQISHVFLHVLLYCSALFLAGGWTVYHI